jgi:hypothetical protein
MRTMRTSYCNLHVNVRLFIRSDALPRRPPVSQQQWRRPRSPLQPERRPPRQLGEALATTVRIECLVRGDLGQLRHSCGQRCGGAFSGRTCRLHSQLTAVCLGAVVHGNY